MATDAETETGTEEQAERQLAVADQDAVASTDNNRGATHLR